MLILALIYVAGKASEIKREAWQRLSFLFTFLDQV